MKCLCNNLVSGRKTDLSVTCKRRKPGWSRKSFFVAPTTSTHKHDRRKNRQRVKRNLLVNSYQPATTEAHRTRIISRRNADLLRIVNRISQEPDDKGENWWNDFITNLNEYRFRI